MTIQSNTAVVDASKVDSTQPGWTCRIGLWHLLAPFFDEQRYGVGALSYLNPAIRERAMDLVLSLRRNRPAEGFVPVFGIDAETATELLNLLPASALQDRQNNGPSLEYSLQSGAVSQDQILLGGYAIGPQRQDERLTLDTIWVNESWLGTANYAELQNAATELIWQEIWEPVRARLHLDALAEPDEISFVELNSGRLGWRMWWD